MPFSDVLDPSLYKSWELTPSTRESVHLLTKPYPVDKTLAVPGTAEDLITVSPGIATVNMVTNPSFETGNPPTGFTAVGSAIAQSAVYYLYGLNSMEINPNNVAKGEGAYYSLGMFPRNKPLSVSCYLRRGAAGSADSRVELYGVTSAARIAVGNSITLDGSWQRSSFALERINIWRLEHGAVTGGPFQEDETITGGTSGVTASVNTVFGAPNNYLVIRNMTGGFTKGETITGGTSLATAVISKPQWEVAVDQELRIYIVTAAQHNVTFYADGLQAEAWPHITAYCDGAQGYAHFWDGVAHGWTIKTDGV